MELWGSAALLKKAETQAFSCEIYKLFKKNYFEEHLWMSASKHYLKRDSTQVLSCEFCKLLKNIYLLEDLQTACPQTPVRGSFFNKEASLMAWKLLTVVERDCCTGISLWIIRNFIVKLLPHMYLLRHAITYFYL